MNTIRHRAVLAGCGDMANTWVKYAIERSNTQIVGLVDIRIESAQAMTNKYALALSAMIASGVIGKPGYACVDFHQGPHFGGFRVVMDNPLLLDMSIHTFDQARKILGADPVSVYCREFNPPGSWFKGNASAICIFEMSNGTVFCYRGSWCTEGGSTSWEGDWRVTGEKGSAIWDGIHPPYAEVARQTGGDIEHIRVDPDLPPFKNMHHYGCLDAMFDSLENHRPAETDCRQNIHSMMIVLGAIESARTGNKVFIDTLLNKQITSVGIGAV